MFMITERLFLRPFWPEDADALAAEMGRPEVLRNLGTPPSPFTLADARARIATDMGAGDDQLSLGMFVRTAEGSRLAGGIGFGPRPDRGGGIALSYWVAKDWWGANLSVEAGRAVLEHAFLARRLPKLMARHYVDNPGSGRVLAKLGFRPTGVTGRYFCVPRHEAVEGIESALTREEWTAARQARAIAA